MLIDTHQHLWDLSKFRLPWLETAPEVLKKSYTPADYRAATQGLDVTAIYMEVDVSRDQRDTEVDYISAICNSGREPTLAAVVGGEPAAADFSAYVARLKQRPRVKGVRQVLHVSSTPAGFCLQENFVRGVRLLGENGLSFDCCMRPTDLQDCVKLSQQCPGVQFILDHCGNGDPHAFLKRPTEKQPAHEANQWRRDIEACAKQSNMICKISGIFAHAPKDWKTEDLAPVVNHCLDAFGPDRVVFGGDWPVCLLGGTFAQWVTALSEIVAKRSEADRKKLWTDNARRIYALRT